MVQNKQFNTTHYTQNVSMQSTKLPWYVASYDIRQENEVAYSKSPKPTQDSDNPRSNTMTNLKMSLVQTMAVSSNDVQAVRRRPACQCRQQMKDVMNIFQLLLLLLLMMKTFVLQQTININMSTLHIRYELI